MIDISVEAACVDIRMSYDDALALFTSLTSTIEHYGSRPRPENDQIGIRFTAPPTGGIDVTLAYCRIPLTPAVMRVE